MEGEGGKWGSGTIARDLGTKNTPQAGKINQSSKAVLHICGLLGDSYITANHS